MVGPTARHLYLHAEIPEIHAWTDADLLHVAARFPDAEFEDSPNHTMNLTMGPLVIRLVCDPLTRTPRNETLPIRITRSIAALAAFTADALLYDPLSDRFLDPIGVLPDIRARKLAPNPFAPGHILDSPEFLFQAILLECEEGYTLTPELLARLKGVSLPMGTETLATLRKGLSDILTSRDPFAGLTRLESLGTLEHMIPEIAAMRACLQDKDFHPEGTVLVHTLECFRNLRRPSLGLALGLLLHDVGKPSTMRVDRHLHFPEHSSVGAGMARRILRRLGFSRELQEEVSFLIRNHLLRKVIRHMGEAGLIHLVRNRWFEDLLRLYQADIQGSMGDLATYREVVKQITPYRKDPRNV